MQKLIIIFLALLLYSNVSAQTSRFQTTFSGPDNQIGNFNADDIIELTDGNFLAVSGDANQLGGVGTTFHAAYEILDKNTGVVNQYTRVFPERGTNQKDELRELVVSNDFIYAFGIVDSTLELPYAHIYMLKFTKTGTLLNIKHVADSAHPTFRINDVVLLDNHFYITSDIRGDSKLIKIDTAGNLIFNKEYGTDFYDFFEGITTSPAKELVVCGGSRGIVYSKVSEPKIGCMVTWVLKIDTLGTLIWQYADTMKFKEQTNPESPIRYYKESFAHGICRSRDGGYLLAINDDWTVQNSNFWDYTPIRLTKLTEDGDTVFSKAVRKYYGATLETVNVIENKDGTVIMGGTLGRAGYLAKYSSTGDSIWERRYAPAQTKYNP